MVANKSLRCYSTTSIVHHIRQSLCLLCQSTPLDVKLSFAKYYRVSAMIYQPSKTICR